MTISDRTCHVFAGVEPRVFRQVVAARSIPHVKLGDRLLVTAVAWAEAMSGARTSDAEDDDQEVTCSPEPTRAEILRRIGARGGR